MVSYQTLTSVGFEVARRKGAQFEGQTPRSAQTLVSVIAEEWAENKEEYRQMTEEQARQRLNSVIRVN